MYIDKNYIANRAQRMFYEEIDSEAANAFQKGFIPKSNIDLGGIGSKIVKGVKDLLPDNIKDK